LTIPALVDDILVKRVLGELLLHVLFADLDLALLLHDFVVGGLPDVGAHAGLAVVHALLLLHGLKLLLWDFDAAALVGAQALSLEHHLPLAPDFEGSRLDGGEDVECKALPGEADRIGFPLRTTVGLRPVRDAAGPL
jgi:hypothetical protein